MGERRGRDFKPRRQSLIKTWVKYIHFHWRECALITEYAYILESEGKMAIQPGYTRAGKTGRNRKEAFDSKCDRVQVRVTR